MNPLRGTVRKNEPTAMSHVIQQFTALHLGDLTLPDQCSCMPASTDELREKVKGMGKWKNQIEKRSLCCTHLWCSACVAQILNVKHFHQEAPKDACVARPDRVLFASCRGRVLCMFKRAFRSHCVSTPTLYTAPTLPVSSDLVPSDVGAP